MCKVFPYSLGPTAMRWFDSVGEGTIYSYKELTRAFGARSITCNRVSQPIDSLLTMSMKEGETLRSYTNRYWKLYNEVVASTFKIGLVEESELRKSLTNNPAETARAYGTN